ncbi:hypothetical protein KVR01_004272 [Diaporthe batatas]|uniref:uncharacterized protein n=1 Tax=Diaporthe batatas TaxID=748121 RepID=UPI001D053204|nr:uncharacterized protein KVR01_004272 [Diaporthe batatas]KAG8165720.1 hypothetical protein KVR01_004272 [Diaporthe batatas]
MRLEDAIDYVAGDYGPSNAQLFNIILRSILHFAGVMACVVPMHLFCRSGEIAGATLVASGAIVNLYHLCNTITWYNDDIASWPLAYGWCDFQVATTVPLETLVAASTCAILRNVSNSITSLRVTALRKSEKRRKNLIHALIIFPVPLLQAILYYFVAAQRFNISGIIGSRRKLYFMTLTIIAPWLPLQVLFLSNNVQTAWPWAAPFDLGSVHGAGWNQIDYIPSSGVPWAHMYGTYAYSLQSLIVFLFFGLTKDAHDLYRGYLRALGLGRIFPRLNEESPGSSNNMTSVGGRQFNELDDIQPLNIRLSSLDVAAARSTTEAARSSEKMTQLPARNPWVFRTTFAPDFNMGTILGGGGKGKGKNTSSSCSQELLRPVIHPLHTSHAPSAMGKYHPDLSAGDAHQEMWNPAPRDTRVQTRVWVADARSGSATDGVSISENEMAENGVVRVEKRISSSSEVSPPKPVYH